MSDEPEVNIFIEGRWDFPHNGNAGSAGQFLTLEAAFAFVTEQDFDSVELVERGDEGDRKASLTMRAGHHGWLFEDGEFIAME
jgi:hypothetical protein